MTPILSDDPGIAVYVRIAQAIIRDIQRQRLKPGAILPSSRELASLLDVNRKTVMLAYEELISQGWITSEGRRGTFVSTDLPLSHRVTSTTRELPARTGPRTSPFETRRRNLPLLLDDHNNTPVAFSDGVPDTRLVPIRELARLQNVAMRSLGHHNSLSYGYQAGSMRLRSSLAEMLNSERGLNALPEEISVTRGSQMAIYLTPHHHYPTTLLMRMPRRMRLLELAEIYRFAIVEDDYDHEFHFQRKPVLPLASTDHSNRVIYIGSLSKLLAPGLRCGYLVAPRDFISEVEKLVLLIDRCGNPVVEAMLADALSSGLIKSHAARSLRIYEARLAHIARRFSEDFRGVLSFRLPAGGLAVWATLEADRDIDTLVVAAGRRNLSITSGTHYSLTGARTNAFRLGYAAYSEPEMDVLLDGLLLACREARP